MGQLTANFVIMDKLLQFLLFLLPFVVESALVRNNIHILRKKILGRNIYDHHVKPDGKVDVSFGIDFMDMDLCPHKQMLSTTVFEKMMWTDNRLVWDKDDFEGIDRIQVNADEVWIPDITLYNSIEAPKMFYSHVEEPSNVVIFSNGLVVFSPLMQFKSHCNVNFNNWPWGEQNCTLIFGSWTYDMAHVNLEGFSLGNSGDTTIALDNFSKSRYEISDTSYFRQEKEYDADPGKAYPRMDLSLRFMQKVVYKNNQPEFNPAFPRPI